MSIALLFHHSSCPVLSSELSNISSMPMLSFRTETLLLSRAPSSCFIPSSFLHYRRSRNQDYPGQDLRIEESPTRRPPLLQRWKTHGRWKTGLEVCQEIYTMSWTPLHHSRHFPLPRKASYAAKAVHKVRQMAFTSQTPTIGSTVR